MNVRGVRIIEPLSRLKSGMVCMIALAGSTACSPQPQPVDPVPKTNSITLRLAIDGALFLDGEPLRPRDLAKELARISDRLRVDAKLSGEPVASDRSLSPCLIFQLHGKTPFSTVYQMATETQSAGFRRWSLVVDSGTNEPISLQPRGTSPAPSPVTSDGDLTEVLRTLPIQLHASDQGDIVRIELAERDFADYEALRVELASILSEPESPFDRVTFTVDGGLNFAELVRAVNLICGLNITKIDFRLQACSPTRPK